MPECKNAPMHGVRIRALVHSCILAFGVVLVAALPVQAAVDDYIGRQVASVRLMIDGRETVDPALLKVVETRAGRPLSMVEVRESLTHLFSLGRFDNVSVDASMEAGGVLLRYDLSPVHVISKIEFAGNLGGIGRRATPSRRYGSVRHVAAAEPRRRIVTGDYRRDDRAGVPPCAGPASRRYRSRIRGCDARVHGRAWWAHPDWPRD